MSETKRTNIELLALAKEIIGWQKTGYLHGDNLREVARTDRHCVGQEHSALRIAERVVTDEILDAFIALYEAPEEPKSNRDYRLKIEVLETQIASLKQDLKAEKEKTAHMALALAAAIRAEMKKEKNL